MPTVTTKVNICDECKKVQKTYTPYWIRFDSHSGNKIDHMTYVSEHTYHTIFCSMKCFFSWFCRTIKLDQSISLDIRTMKLTTFHSPELARR